VWRTPNASLAQLRQQWSAKKQQLLAELQSQRRQVWQQLERRQREDLRECWSHVQRGMASVPDVLPLEVWVRYGPELSQRYLGWEETQLAQKAEQAWKDCARWPRRLARRRRILRALLACAVLLAGLAIITAYRWPPELNVVACKPPQPIAGEPLTIEFTTWSLWFRRVYVEWRYAGESEWRRLEQSKLHIPEVKSQKLALEFRAVDSKGFAGSVVQGQWQVFVPTPALKITRQDPPNGPIAGAPFTVEFEATSPVGRAVHVEWRYAGEARWQRLAEPKLGIPEVKGETLALEFRAVDSKGYSFAVLAQHWDVSFMVRQMTCHEAWVSSVAVTPDGKYVVSGSGDKTVRLWELATGKEVRRFPGHDKPVYSVAVTPDGKYVVSGSLDNTVRLWELETGKEVRRFTGHGDWVMNVAVTPDGKYVVSGSGDKTLRLWELATGKEVRRFPGHADWVMSVAVTPDGKYVVSGSGDGTLRLWDLAKGRLWNLVTGGREVRRFTGHDDSVRTVAVTPDGKYVVSGSLDRTVRLWELETGKEVRRFTGHEHWVNSVAVTPDGRYIVSGSWDNTARLWELATGKEVRRFTGHGRPVLSVAVTPDGQYVVSGSYDNTVRVWYIGDLRKQAR
jgi:DNA-binding beta-propeller fold protein YncE